MTRDEQIAQGAIAYEKHLRAQGYLAGYASSMADGFIDGVRWADANPGWHKYPSEPPEGGKRYLVAYKDGHVALLDYNGDAFGAAAADCFLTSEALNDNITHWMALPESPKFD